MKFKLKPIPTWGLIALFLAALLFDLLKSFPSVDRQRYGEPECQATNSSPFDGQTLYHCTVQAVARTHKGLQDPGARDSFVKEWLRKYDASGQLATEMGTMKAITEMLLSLRGRFDYVLAPKQVAEEKLVASGRLAGIGATLAAATHQPSTLSLPEHMTPQLAASLADQLPQEEVFSDTRPMVVAADPEAGTPAQKAGLKQGDEILLVDGQPVAGSTMSAVVDTLRGAPGTRVVLTIKRARQKLDLTVVRNFVELPIVEAKTAGEIGYLRIAHFASMSAVNQTERALAALCGTPTAVDTHCSSRALILDLRDNPGGLLDAVILISELFVDTGDIVTVRQRDGDRLVESNISLDKQSLLVIDDGVSRREDRHLSLHFPRSAPLIVLINENSASGAEMLAAVLQKQRQAIVVGQQTRGKGVGQCQVDLPYGFSSQLICMDFVPGGTAIDFVGVIPDIIVNQHRAAQPAATKATDRQLEAALILAEGKTPTNLRSTEATIEKLADRKAAYEAEVQETLRRFFQ